MMRKKQVPDAFYFPQSFMAGCLISFVSVFYMSIKCFQLLGDFKTNVQKSYSNVYDSMFSFFRTGNEQMMTLMKVQLDQRIASPFLNKLNVIRLMLEDITVAMQVAFFIAIVVAILVFLCSLINLIFDYKKRILLARKGKFEDFAFDHIEVMAGSNFPGYTISTSIAGFVITLGCLTIVLTILFWPIFWRWVWTKRTLVLTVVIPSIVIGVIAGWVQDFVYD